jgi:hypothetical protein
MSIWIYISDPWPMLWDQDYCTEKNHEAKFLTNLILKDEIEKKNNFKKHLKQKKKIAIKKMMTKFQTKTKRQDIFYFL